MKRYAPVAARFVLALPMLIFGMNKLAHLFALPPPPGDTARMFLGAMFGSYLVTFVGLTEILGALLLTRAKTTLLGALVLLPVTLNIVLFHAAHDVHGIGIGLICFALNVYLAVRGKERLALLLEPTEGREFARP